METLNLLRQGDCMVIRLPDTYSLTKPKDQEKKDGIGMILLHGEGAHHVHAIHEDDKIEIYEGDSEDTTIGILKVKQATTLEHLHTETKEWTKEHAPIQLDPGLYFIERQREYLPNGYALVKD